MAIQSFSIKSPEEIVLFYKQYAKLLDMSTNFLVNTVLKERADQHWNSYLQLQDQMTARQKVAFKSNWIVVVATPDKESFYSLPKTNAFQDQITDKVGDSEALPSEGEPDWEGYQEHMNLLIQERDALMTDTEQVSNVSGWQQEPVNEAVQEEDDTWN